MNAGNLKHKIEIEIKEFAKEGNNFRREEWVKYSNPYAQVEHLRGKEPWFAFTIRYDNIFMNEKDIEDRFRVKYQNKTFSIKVVDNVDFKNQWIIIKALQEEVK